MTSAMPVRITISATCSTTNTGAKKPVEHWEQACRLDPEFSIPWRNLGIAYYNVRRQPDRAHRML